MHYARMKQHGELGGPGRWGGTSQPEAALADFVDALGVESVRGSRKVIPGHQELDIYIPERNFAIEFNGNYWHSEDKVGRDYHHAKWLACKEQGIQLLQIWEDQWGDRRAVVEQMIARKVLGSKTPGIGARKTVVVDLDRATSDAFLEPMHIQGGATGGYYIGLVHEDALVAVGVFKRRGDGATELIRYASTLTVQGGLSKMMKRIGPGRYVTFADHCVSDGGLYERTGWTKDSEIKPDYRYLVDGARLHKFNYRLARFRRDPGLLWEDGLTERQLADLNGLSRIWDAGKTRYVLDV